ncbi:MAG: class I SAM-dependent methyltransferase [Oscillospiraceae bacterium]
MNIEEQFNLIANEYDVNRRRFIPCFDDYYANTTRFIACNITPPKRVLDLGAGTGLLTYYWLKEFAAAEYVLTDIAEEMLEVSKRRFFGLPNVHHQVLDYTERLPDGEFDAIISALSIHHLEDSQKAELFKRIYDKLPVGGIFVNYDQFCAGTPTMNRRFDSYWEKQIMDAGLTAADIELWKERRKLDKECSVEKEEEMLRQCMFSDVKCVYSYHKFSVILAVK